MRRSADAIFKEQKQVDALDAWDATPVLLRNAVTKVCKQYSHSLYMVIAWQDTSDWQVHQTKQ